MAFTPQEEDIVINIIAKIDEKYKAQAEKALDTLVKRAENSIASDVTRALNDRIRNKQQAIAEELKLENQRRAKELAQLKADIQERAAQDKKLNDIRVKQAFAANKQIQIDAEKARREELAQLKASIIANTSKMYTRTTDTSGRRIYGDFSDITTQTTYKADSGAIWKNMQADAAKAGAQSAREFSKTFWGAIEGGTTFGHKLATTFQYATAGTAFYAVVSSVSAMTNAFLESNKALHMFIGVLEMTESQAKNLQKSIFDVGTTYGGQLKDLNEAALSLGRAGISTADLSSALKSVSQLALVSGESLQTVTDVMVSWKTLYPDRTIGQLGDVIVKVANETKASVADFNTMSTYILTAGQQAGLTAEALAALAGAAKQIGKGSSTAGTEIRRFFQQLESGSDDVRKAWSNLGINMDQLRENLLQGGPVAEQTMLQLFDKLRDIPQKEGQKAIMHVGEVLDKATLKTMLAIANSGDKGLNEFTRIFNKAKTEATGSANKAATEVALSFSVALERIQNTLFAQANTFGSAFTKNMFGDTTVDEFNAALVSINSNTSTLSQTMVALSSATGSAAGAIFTTLGTALDGYIKSAEWVIYLTKESYQWIDRLSNQAGVDFIKYLDEAAIAIGVFTAALRINPIIAWAGAIVTATSALKEYFDLKSQIEGSKTSMIASSAFARDLEALKGYDSASKKIEAVSKGIGVLQGKLDNLYKVGPGSTAFSRTDSKTQKAIEVNIKVLEDRIAKMNKLRTDLVNAVNEKKAGKTTVAVPDISGATKVEGKKRSRASTDRNRQQELDSYKEIIKENEQEYYLQYGINNELSKKQYHLEATLPALLSIAELTVDEQKRTGEVAKVRREIAMTSLEIVNIQRQMSENGANALQQAQDEYKLAQLMPEVAKLRLAEEIKVNNMQLQLADNIVNNKMLEKDALDLYNQQVSTLKLITDEQIRQIELGRLYESQGIRTGISRMKEDYVALTDYEKERNALLREAEDLELSIVKNYEMKNELTEIDIANMERADELRKRSDYNTYVAMQLQQSMQAELNSSLMDFFNIQSEGWMDFEKLGMNVLNNIMQEMIKMQVVQPLASSGANLFSSAIPGVMSWASGLFMAKGGVTIGGNPTYLARGGSYVNSIVKKPTYVANGTIAGESGREGVLPLQRDSQGRLGVISSGSNGTPQAINVTIRNESGEALAVTRTEPTMDAGEMFLDIWIDAVARNRKGARDIVRGVR